MESGDPGTSRSREEERHRDQQEEEEEGPGDGEEHEEEEEAISFGASEPPSPEAAVTSGMRGSRGASTDSQESSNSSLATAASDDSAIMATARASSRQSSQGYEESNLQTSMSRKQGWLPFPPPVKAPGRGSDHSSDPSTPLTNPSDDTRASQLGTSYESRSPLPSPLASPTNVSGSIRGTSLSSSPTMKMYTVKVRKLYYKLTAPKNTVLAKLKNLFTKGSMDKDSIPTDRFILRNINFEAKPSEVLAIAGPSGAGKSTLLECLAGRVKPAGPPGSILVNNQVMDTSTFRRISGYVMQDDAMFPTLTVMETLLMSARLRLPANMTMAEKVSRVQSLMGELGLQAAANTRIGNEMMRGVSGGERRRVSIGVDVIHDPAVLILDEPTSGLDSAAALNVVSMLRDMAVSRGRTVILSIHQPSYRILQLMHSLLLLAGGLVVHHGSLDLLASRLTSAGHEIPPRTNVLEYAIDAVNSWESEDLLGNYVTIAKGLSMDEIFTLDKEFHGDPDTLAIDIPDNRGLLPPKGSQEGSAYGSDPGGGDDPISYPNNILQETAILTERFFKNILRTKELFTARSLQAVLAGVILGTVFLNVDDDSQGVSDRMGFFLFTVSFLLNSTTEALPIFLQERQILMRETSRGAYRISSYVLSHTVVFVPFLLVIAILYGAPSYWLTGLNSSFGNFAFYCLVLWLTILLANSFVAFFSALVPNYIMGQALIAAFMGAFFLFSGYLINRNNIPKYWIWMHYISLFKFPFESLLLNEFDSQRSKCYQRSSFVPPPPPPPIPPPPPPGLSPPGAPTGYTSRTPFAMAPPRLPFGMPPPRLPFGMPPPPFPNFGFLNHPPPGMPFAPSPMSSNSLNGFFFPGFSDPSCGSNSNNGFGSGSSSSSPPGTEVCMLTGAQVLHNAGVQGRHKWVDVGVMVGMIILYRILCYITVRWRLSQRIRGSS